MSSRPCNYCTYIDIVSEAQAKGQKAELKVDDSNILPSKTARGVYVDGKFIAWFMELPDSCAC